MQLRPHLVPPKQEESQKTGFQKKGENPLRRQSTPKNVADIPRIRRPVGAELKFHDDPGRNTDGKRQAKNLNPELRGPK